MIALKHKELSVILLDIETSPLVGYSWQTYDTNVLKVIEPSKIISIAWKQLGAKETSCKCIADYRGYKSGVVNDEALIREIWDVLDKADIVIAHHGVAFDFKKLNARFVFYGLNSPSHYQVVDTKKEASKHFKFDSNSLNNLGSYLNVGQKINNGGFELWVECMGGDKKAWERMKSYNIQDVILLEQVYLKLRPFMSTHPDMNLMLGENIGQLACGSCLSLNLTKRGFALTKIGSKQRYQCSDCGSWTTGPWVRKTRDNHVED